MRKLQSMLARMMQGRNGMDNLGLAALWMGLIMSLLSSILGLELLWLLGLALYAYSIFRMFSRNTGKRAEENRRYVQRFSGWQTKVRQFFIRLKNCRVYKYFKCPQCHTMLRLKRGSGVKAVHCPKCGHGFDQKA